MRLSSNAGLILGIMSAHPHSGYALKKHAEAGLRPFWRLGYPQLYRELAALRRAGLIVATERVRLRGRTTYGITRRGAAALRAWIESGSGGVELRDELLLKLYLAALVRPRSLRAVARMVGARERALVVDIEGMEEHLRSNAHDEEELDAVILVLRVVRDLHRAYERSMRTIAGR